MKRRNTKRTRMKMNRKKRRRKRDRKSQNIQMSIQTGIQMSMRYHNHKNMDCSRPTQPTSLHRNFHTMSTKHKALSK
ncbi:MAG: hypothetical protein J6U62_02480 [Bacteroidaceae bacterium]|nr:hypothetical protein [Bacteroidaceae bacterium]